MPKKLINDNIQEDEVLPDEMIIKILNAVETPKELLLWRQISRQFNRLVFDKRVWEKFLPSFLKKNTYSPTVYQFFARAYHIPFYQNVIDKHMARPRKFHKELIQWSDVKKNNILKINDQDEYAGILPFLFDVNEARNYFEKKITCSDAFKDPLYLSHQQWHAVLMHGDEALRDTLVRHYEKQPDVIFKMNFQHTATAGLLDAAKALWEKASVSEQEMLQNTVFPLALEQAIIDAHLTTVAWLWEKAPSEVKTNILQLAYYQRCFVPLARKGKLEMLTWLLQQANEAEWLAQVVGLNEKKEWLVFQAAAKGAHLPVLERLLSLAGEDERPAMLAAIFSSSELHIKQWIWEQTIPDQHREMLAASDYSAFHYATEQGCLETSKWLWQKARDNKERTAMLRSDGYRAFFRAAAHGHLPILEWLWEMGYDERPAMLKSGDRYIPFISAFDYGHAAIFKWLWDRVDEKQWLCIGEKVITRSINNSESTLLEYEKMYNLMRNLIEQVGISNVLESSLAQYQKLIKDQHKLINSHKGRQLFKNFWRGVIDLACNGGLNIVEVLWDLLTDLQRCDAKYIDEKYNRRLFESWQQASERCNSLVLESISRFAFYCATVENFAILEQIWQDATQTQRCMILRSNIDYYRQENIILNDTEEPNYCLFLKKCNPKEASIFLRLVAKDNQANSTQQASKMGLTYFGHQSDDSEKKQDLKSNLRNSF